jgi:hypothetical protein
MDDITDKLKGLLDSPEGLEQIKSLAASFLGNNNSEKSDEKEHHNKEREHHGKEKEHSSSSPLSALGLGDIDINMMLKIKSALESFNGDNEKFELLHALKPHLKPARQTRVDEAIKILRLVNLMPLFKENGFL